MVNITTKNNSINFKFSSMGAKQKILIDALLKYSRLDIRAIASMLDVSLNALQEVYNGENIFHEQYAENLTLLFLIFFSD